MSRRGMFWTALFAGGWIAHALLSYFWRTPAPAPQIMLLAVLAVGAMGRVDAAQTLGFFWGLILDAQGVTLFGTQGWILAALGFASGAISKQIDGEKPYAQALLAVGGTLFYLAALAQIEFLFRRAGGPHVPGPGAALVQVLMNLAAAPAVFRAVHAWARAAWSGEDDRVFRS